MINISVSPIALTIGPFEIRWYGVMIAIAVLFLVFWTLRAIKGHSEFTPDHVFTAAIIGIPSGIIVSRFLHVIENMDYFGQHPGEIIGAAGLTIYGAVLGTALGLWIYSRFSKFNYGLFVDLMAPGIIVAQAIGRVGCLLNGCCYGIESSLPCSIVYTHPKSYGPLGVAVLPTQVFEIVFDLVVFGVLLLLRGRFKPNGSLFLIYLSLYSAWRLVIDFFRDGKEILFGLHEAQLIGIAILCICIFLLTSRTHGRKREKTASVEAAPPQSQG